LLGGVETPGKFFGGRDYVLRMTTAAQPLRLKPSAQHQAHRLASYVFLIGLIVLAVFTQKQLPEVSIHPTGPLPAVNIP
jgi:hypothetical protein